MADEHEPRHDPPHDHEPARDNGATVVATTDDVVDDEARRHADLTRHPEATTVMETNRLGEAVPIYVPAPCAVVVGRERPERRRQDDDEKGPDDDRAEHGPEGKRGDGEGRPKKKTEKDRDQEKDEKAESRDHDRDRRDDRREEDRPQHAQDHSSGMRTWLLAGGAGLVLGVLLFWGYSHFFGDRSKSGDQASSSGSSKSSSGGGKSSQKKSAESGGKSSGSDKTSESSSIPGFTSAEDADTLKRQIEDLSERIDRMDKRIDTLRRPQNETPPVLHTLQFKIGELSRTMDEVANLPSRVRRLENRLDELDERVKTLRTRISTDEDERDEPTTQMPDAVPSTTTPAPVPASSPPVGADGAMQVKATDATMELGLGLFGRGQYVQARDLFRRLQRTRPNDARVWYLSALANGMVTGVWDGETKRLVEKGVELERAGNPATAQINSALAAVSPSARDWIAFYRKRSVR
ncbi:MAG TPA: hypothetical protein VG406_19330 [Isosphaeraceae bacterium]|jgi:TolA-binding protein|nr:hypothetical protein [Isosphaeraceae bacterium]